MPMEAEPVRPEAPAPGPQTAAGAAAPGTIPSDWAALIEQADLRGPVGQLARHATLVAIEGRLVRLAMKPSFEHLAVGPMVAQLEQQLGTALGRDVKVKFERDTAGSESPAERQSRASRERLDAAAAALHGDPVVQSLVDTFGARVIPESVRPSDA